MIPPEALKRILLAPSVTPVPNVIVETQPVQVQLPARFTFVCCSPTGSSKSPGGGAVCPPLQVENVPPAATHVSNAPCWAPDNVPKFVPNCSPSVAKLMAPGSKLVPL